MSWTIDFKVYSLAEVGGKNPTISAVMALVEKWLESLHNDAEREQAKFADRVAKDSLSEAMRWNRGPASAGPFSF